MRNSDHEQCSWMSFQNLWRTANPSRFRAQTMRIHKLLAPLERIWHHNSQARSPLPRGRRIYITTRWHCKDVQCGYFFVSWVIGVVEKIRSFSPMVALTSKVHVESHQVSLKLWTCPSPKKSDGETSSSKIFQRLQCSTVTAIPTATAIMHYSDHHTQEKAWQGTYKHDHTHCLICLAQATDRWTNMWDRTSLQWVILRRCEDSWMIAADM